MTPRGFDWLQEREPPCIPDGICRSEQGRPLTTPTPEMIAALKGGAGFDAGSDQPACTTQLGAAPENVRRSLVFDLE